MDKRFSVLIPIYAKEKPSFFRESLDSVINQTLLPSEIVIVKDGPLTEELEKVITEFINNHPGLIKVISFESKNSLGIVLAAGVKACSYELIARMDSDDVSRKDRFEKQIAEFSKDPQLDICGSQLAEFTGTIDNIVSHRRVALADKDIKHYQRMRSAFNHPTIMFKKTSVLNAGNYDICPNMEDGYLYVRMFLNGATAMNLSEELVFARVGDALYKRRGGIDYFINYKMARKKILATGFISKREYYYSIFVHFIVATVPLRLRGIIYRNILHR